MIDKGINVHFFKGNHDMWTINYFEKIGLKVYDNLQSFNIDQSNIIVGHGDGLGKGDNGYKILKSIFKNNLSQFLFRILHPLFDYLNKNNGQIIINNYDSTLFNFIKRFDNPILIEGDKSNIDVKISWNYKFYLLFFLDMPKNLLPFEA